jgi:protein arginine kinase activator
MHKGTNHIGKEPTRKQRSLEREQELKDLHRNLRKAVSDENYESAAEIRDRIRSLDVEA